MADETTQSVEQTHVNETPAADAAAPSEQAAPDVPPAEAGQPETPADQGNTRASDLLSRFLDQAEKTPAAPAPVQDSLPPVSAVAPAAPASPQARAYESKVRAFGDSIAGVFGNLTEDEHKKIYTATGELVESIVAETFGPIQQVQQFIRAQQVHAAERDVIEKIQGWAATSGIGDYGAGGRLDANQVQAARKLATLAEGIAGMMSPEERARPSALADALQAAHLAMQQISGKNPAVSVSERRRSEGRLLGPSAKANARAAGATTAKPLDAARAEFLRIMG